MNQQKKVFQAEIDRLTAKIDELEEKLKSQEAHIVEEVTAMFRGHTAKAKADAIREFIELYAKASIVVHSNHSVKFYADKYIADNLEGKSEDMTVKRVIK